MDNASEDGSPEFVREHFGSDPRVEILECSKNLGWSGGNNRGLEKAVSEGADYALLLNNDTAVDAGAIECLISYAEHHPEVGALAPKLLLYDQPEILNSVGLELSVIASAWDAGIGRLDAPKWGRHTDVAGVCGAGLFLRVDVLQKTGLLPEDFEIYLDDLDLCLRIWNAGYKVRSCPEAEIRHKYSATMGEGSLAERKYYLNTRNRLRLILRNFPAWRLPYVLCLYMLGECRGLGRLTFNGEWRRVWSHKRSWISGLLYLPRAATERFQRRGRGLGPCRFWHLIRRDLWFFAGTELPQDGWYAPRSVGGEILRPMSAHATYEHGGGGLRLVETNCYPRLGDLDIEVVHRGSRLTTLRTMSTAEHTYDLRAGKVEFSAKHIFAAEETGEPYDIGGWIGVESEDA